LIGETLSRVAGRKVVVRRFGNPISQKRGGVFCFELEHEKMITEILDRLKERNA